MVTTWYRWVPLLGLGILVLEQIVDRERLDSARRRHRGWRQTAKALPAADRRAVGRAVYRGVAVSDPSLADAAVELAGTVAGRRGRSLLRWISDAVFAVWIVTPMIVAGTRHHWVRMGICALGPVFFGALWLLTPRFRARARAALAANRAVPRPRPPAAPIVPQPFDLGIGLPKSVARARRQARPGSSA